MAQTHDPDREHDDALVRETLHARRCSSAASKNGSSDVGVAGTTKVNASGDAHDVA